MKYLFIVLGLSVSACGTQSVTSTPLNCTVKSTDSGSVISCPDGSRSFVSNGVNGQDGQNGINGVNGTNGQDGTQVTPIKFCTESASYPARFPEYGLCLNDSLYAVYSANGGFLALLPEGNYSSNAIGSACSFKVKAHCQIERL